MLLNSIPILLSLILCSIGCSELPTTYIPPDTGDTTYSGRRLSMVWNTKESYSGTNGNINSTPIKFGDNIVVGYKNTIQSLNLIDGSINWTFTNTTDNNRNYWPAISIFEDAGKIYAVMGTKVLICLDGITGSVVWKYAIEKGEIGYCFSNYSHSSEKIFFVTSIDNKLHAISKSTGEVVWTSQRSVIPDTPIKFDTIRSDAAAATYYKGRVYISSWVQPNSLSGNGACAIFDAQTGERIKTIMFPFLDSTSGYPLWQQAQHSAADNPIIPTEEGLLCYNGFAVSKIDRDGNFIWSTVPNIDNGISAMSRTLLQVHNNSVYGFNNGNGRAFAFSLDLVTGKQQWTKWLAYNGQFHTVLFHTPVISDGVLYKVTDDQWLYAINLSDGSIKFTSNLMINLAYLGFKDDGYEGALLVHKDSIYFSSLYHMMCLTTK